MVICCFCTYAVTSKSPTVKRLWFFPVVAEPHDTPLFKLEIVYNQDPRHINQLCSVERAELWPRNPPFVWLFIFSDQGLRIESIDSRKRRAPATPDVGELTELGFAYMRRGKMLMVHDLAVSIEWADDSFMANCNDRGYTIALNAASNISSFDLQIDPIQSYRSDITITRHSHYNSVTFDP